MSKLALITDNLEQDRFDTLECTECGKVFTIRFGTEAQYWSDMEKMEAHECRKPDTEFIEALKKAQEAGEDTLFW